MSWDAAFAAERDATARGPLAAQPATFGEIWDASWRAAGLDTTFGVGRPWQQAYEELRGQVETIAGAPMADLAARRNMRLSGSLQAQAGQLADIAAGFTPEQQEKIKPYLDIPARARAIAGETERQAADIADRTYGLSGHAVGFLAGTARQALDPVNLATMFVGGPARSAVLPMLAREFGLGVAVQAAQEPAIEAGRAELGLEAGFGRALTNTLEAGIGNAGLAGLFRGAGWLMRRAIEPRDAVTARPVAESPAASVGQHVHAGSPEPVAARAADVPVLAEASSVRPDAGVMPAALRDLAPEDLAAAAHVVERDRLIDAASPDPSSAGKAVHAEAVAEMTARMEASTAEIMAGFDRKLEELATRLREGPSAQGETAGGAEVSPPASAPARRRPERSSVISAIDELRSLRQSDMNAPVPERRARDQTYRARADRLARDLGILDGAEIDDLLKRDERAGIAASRRRGLLGELQNLIERDVPTAREEANAAALVRHEARLAEIVDELRLPDDQFAAHQRWRDEITTEAKGIRARAAEAGHDLSAHADDIEAAAELLARGVESDWRAALERVAVQRALSDDVPIPAVRELLDDIPGWDLDDAISARETSSDRGAARSGGEDPARQADRRGSAPAGDDVPQPGEARPGEGGRESDAPLADIGRLAAATDDPESFRARLADIERAMAAAGGDLTVHLDGGDVSLRAHLDEIRADAAAADALKGCLGRTGGSA